MSHSDLTNSVCLSFPSVIGPLINSHYVSHSNSFMNWKWIIKLSTIQVKWKHGVTGWLPSSITSVFCCNISCLLHNNWWVNFSAYKEHSHTVIKAMSVWQLITTILLSVNHIHVKQRRSNCTVPRLHTYSTLIAWKNIFAIVQVETWWAIVVSVTHYKIEGKFLRISVEIFRLWSESKHLHKIHYSMFSVFHNNMTS